MKHTENSKKFKLKRKLKLITKYKKVYVFILAGAALFFLVKTILSLNYFKIERVTITGDLKYVSSNDLKIVSEKNAFGQNSISFNTSAFETTLKDTFLYLRDVKTSVNLPKALVVAITERKPVALLLPEQTSKYYFIDEDGFILGEAEAGLSLPVIVYEGNGDVKIGSFLSEAKVSAYVKILALVDKSNIKIKNLKVNGNLVSLTTESNISVFLSAEKDIEASVALLSEVLTKYSLENKVLKKVDLRYDRVVVE